MFNYFDNKYSKTYFKIIEKAQTRRIPHRHWRKRHLNDNYYELHHKCPTSLGGLDTPDNHVYLTAKEHFVAHLLLPKMLTGNDKVSMLFALSQMLKIPKKMEGLRYVPTGRTFEIARKAAAEATRGNVEIASKISASRLGKKLSEEHKQKISSGLKGYKKSPEAAKKASAAQLGKPKSEASKEKMRLAWIARRKRKAAGLEVRKPMSEQARANISAARSGKKLTSPRKPMSEQARANIAAAKLGKKLASPRKPLSAQALQNVREAAAKRKGIPLSKEHREKISAGIIESLNT